MVARALVARMWREGATANVAQRPERVKQVHVRCTLGWAVDFREAYRERGGKPRRH